MSAKVGLPADSFGFHPRLKATSFQLQRWVEMISVSEMSTVNRTSDCGEVVMLGSPDEKNGALTQALLVFCT